MRSARPLARFSVVDTCDLDETRAGLARNCAPPALELVSHHRPFRAIVNGYRLQHIGLNYGWYSTELRMQFPEIQFASQIFALGGKSEARINGVSTAMSFSCSLVVSPGESFTVTNRSECERLILTVNPIALANKLSVIIGKCCSRPLKFNPIQTYALPTAKALRDHFLFLVDAVSASAAPLPNLALDEFEQTLMVMFLYANRHNYSNLLERASLDPAPWQVRRAEEFIEANSQQAIKLEDLAEISGVSAFSLFRAFKKSRGYSPMQFLSQVRSKRQGMPR